MADEQRRARVVLMTEGSRGDHQPYIALARTLQREFDVTLVVNDGFQEMAREYGYAHFRAVDKWAQLRCSCRTL